MCKVCAYGCARFINLHPYWICWVYIYLENEVVVKEYCECLNDEKITDLESYFKNTFVKKAYEGMLNTKAKEYRKKREIEGVELSVRANKEKGEKKCDIYIILNKENHYLTHWNILSEIVKVDFFIKSKLYNKHETFCVYENKSYRTKLSSIFQIDFQDLI